MGEVLPEAPPEFLQITAEELDGGFAPPAHLRRSLERSVLQWFSSGIDDTGPLCVTSPAETEIDISGMTGWPRAVLAVHAQGNIVDLTRPPSFQQLAHVPGAKLKDALAAACLLEAATLIRQPIETRPAELSDATPIQEIADEFTAWLIQNGIAGPNGIESLTARNGLSLATVPTLKELARELGVTRSGLKRISDRIDRELRRDDPLSAGLDRLRVQFIRSVLGGPGAVAEALSRWTNDPDVLAAFIAKTGDRRLSRLIRSNTRDLVNEFVDTVQSLVHSVGVIPVSRIAEQIDEWDCQLDDIAYACGSSQEIELEDDLAISKLSWGPLAVGVKRSLKVAKTLSLIDSYTGAIRHLRRHRPPRLPLLEEFRVFVAKAPDLAIAGCEVSSIANLSAPQDFDAFLLKSLSLCESGLASKSTLATMATRAGYSAASVDNYCTTSPLLDYACSGVMRTRGASVDVARAEELRHSSGTRSSWAQWGWLDAERIWLEAGIANDTLRPSPPADVELLLRGRSFVVYAADRTSLGNMKFSEEGVVVFDWNADNVGTPEDQKSLHVFVVGRLSGSVVRLTAAVGEDDAYPGDVDGCVLVDGRWWLVIAVDEELLAGDTCLVPLSLIKGVVGALGEETVLSWEGSNSVRLRREPHCGVVAGLGACVRSLGHSPPRWIRIAFTPLGLKMEPLGSPDAGTREDLLARVGLSSAISGRPYFSAIGGALGLGANQDRRDVLAAFRRRGRPDLVALAERTPGVSPPRQSAQDLLVQLDAKAGDVIVTDRDGRPLEPVSVATIGGPRPLGLEWKIRQHGGGSFALRDSIWARWVTAVLRAWLVANCAEPLTFRIEGDGWVYRGIRFARLLDAFEAVDVPDCATMALPLLENYCPPTGLGFVNLITDAVASGLREVVISDAGVLAFWADGSSTGGPFSMALTPAR